MILSRSLNVTTGVYSIGICTAFAEDKLYQLFGTDGESVPMEAIFLGHGLDVHVLKIERHRYDEKSFDPKNLVARHEVVIVAEPTEGFILDIFFQDPASLKPIWKKRAEVKEEAKLAYRLLAAESAAYDLTVEYPHEEFLCGPQRNCVWAQPRTSLQIKKGEHLWREELSLDTPNRWSAALQRRRAEWEFLLREVEKATQTPRENLEGTVECFRRFTREPIGIYVKAARRCGETVEMKFVVSPDGEIGLA